MGVHEGSGQLNKALKDLSLRWVEVQSQWGDVRSHDFEKRFLEPLAMEVRDASGAMNNMAVLIQQIRRDCE